MKDDDLCHLTIAEASDLIRSRQLSPVDLVQAHLERIDEIDGKLNSFLTLLSEQALEDARTAEAQIASGRYLGPLHGIPIGLKDLYYTRGVLTTAGSRVFEDFVPQEDAVVVAKLRSGGAIIMGKLNLDEFARGGTNENPHFGPCRNPWDLERVPGGSSGGSGAAVIAGLAMGALGSDTGGSIRIPAALCGIVGLKPTYGLLSTDGVVPLAWTLDHAGPMTRTVTDNAIMLNGMLSQSTTDTIVPELNRDIRGLRLGILKELSSLALDPEVERVFGEAVKELEGLGARIEDISMPSFADAAFISAVIVGAEAFAFHQPHLKATPEKYGPGVRDRNESGAVILAADYVKAQRARTALVQQFNDVFATLDAIISPTCAVPAPLIGSKTVPVGGEEESMLVALAKLTRGFNVTGNPALSVPCGFTEAGLPVGLQIVGRPFDEGDVLRVGHNYQNATGWHLMRPPL